MLHIGEQEITIAMPKVKKIYAGKNFIGLAKGDEPSAQENNEEKNNENKNKNKEEE